MILSQKLMSQTSKLIKWLLPNNNRKARVYNDYTDKLLYRSSKGDNYVLVAYHYDAKAILVNEVKIKRLPHY